MEGMHLDPGLYLYEFGRHAQALSHAPEGPAPVASPPQQQSQAALNGGPDAAAAAAVGGVSEAGAQERRGSLQVDVDGDVEAAEDARCVLPARRCIFIALQRHCLCWPDAVKAAIARSC